MIVTTDGYILTNNHVVEDADKIEVTVGNGETKTYTAKVIGTDPMTDVAVLKIEATGLPAATIGDSAKLRVGDIVLAAGNPMELSQTVTQGIVSAMGRTGMRIVQRDGIENFIQTDAAINPGNSGGPLVDAMGRVIGINTAIMTRTGMNAGIGFSIPINLALRIGEDLLDDGKVSRGFLGVGDMQACLPRMPSPWASVSKAACSSASSLRTHPLPRLECRPETWWSEWVASMWTIPPLFAASWQAPLPARLSPSTLFAMAR